MSKFDESKVINCLHTDKAEIGKKYYFEDSLYELKAVVEDEKDGCIGKLTKVVDGYEPFVKNNGACWEYIYPHEEPPKKRMTYRQLSEWLAKGNGEFIDSKGEYCIPMCAISYSEERRNEPVRQDIRIRTWDSDEWIEPTVDIYERDCK